MRHTALLVLAAVLAVLAAAAAARAQTAVGSAFTYQGSLTDAGSPANGQYDLQFKLFDAASAGNQMGGTLTLEDVPVSAGVFGVRLDFGSSWFLGSARWLEIGVRPGASTGSFTVLGRQELTPTPFALGLSLPMQQVFATAQNVVQFTNSGSGNAAQFLAGGTAANYAVRGTNSSTGFSAGGVLGEATGNSGAVVGVTGNAVNSPLGIGVVGSGTAIGASFIGNGATSTGVYARGYSLGLQAQNLGTGSAIYAVGNGASRENATVRITNTQASAGMCEYSTNNSTWANTHLQNDGTGEVLWLQRGTNPGNYIVATDGSDAKFWVDAAGVTHTKVLEILGGADLSERFDVGDARDAVEPGTVVSIDPEHEGRLLPSREAYDRRVAGVVSGAGGVRPGMVMAQEGSVAAGGHAVALTGRVYCRVTAAHGPIRPGDLLTTSDVPGLAMRADDPSRAPGAILGKAMGSLERGEGLVLVLVGLQ